MKRSRQNITKGFSLIEMMAVLVLLAMTISIAVPAISSIGRTRASGELQRFSVFVRKNLMYAMQKNVTVRVVINLTDGKYWAEESSDPVVLYSTTEDSVEASHLEELVEEEIKRQGDDPFEGKGGADGKVDTYFDMMSAKAEDEDLEEDFFNWENFVPQRIDIRTLIKPQFSPIGKEYSINDSLLFTEFFSYQSVEVKTPDDASEKTGPAQVAVYLFSSGKVEPFFLAIGDSSGRSFSHLSVDFFMKSKIKPGGIGEDAQKIKNAFSEDEDAEGKS
ncbi:type II secretion system protein [bacterium]|nr:type II secretion system protein [bacterium]